MSHDPGVAAASGTGGLELAEVEAQGTVTLKVFRGTKEGGKYVEYTIPRNPGMVVLDVVHQVQAKQEPDLACRWNCKAGKCGSCSAEINGRPRLMCMTRLEDLLGPQAGDAAARSGAASDNVITVAPMKAFPVVKDLVTDVSFNYRVNEGIQPFTPRAMDDAEKVKGEFRMHQVDVDRVQEFRKCIECFLCQDVCHVLRTHQKHDEFSGPRWMVRYASLEMHPADEGDRIDHVWKDGGIGMCNITKCCTEVCPEHITITDNAIIPLKERVVSERFDPLVWLYRRVTGKGKKLLPMAK